MRHFFREFAGEVEDFVRKFRPKDLITLGTDENVATFREFLPEPLQALILFSGAMQAGEASSEVIARIQPQVEAERVRESRALPELLRAMVKGDYLATAGFLSTLVALQQGKADTLVIEQDQERERARCSQCGFIFGREVERLPL